MTNIHDISVQDVLTPFLQQDKEVSAAARSLDPSMEQIAVKIDDLPVLARIDRLTDEEADELAWQFHVDFYDTTLPLIQKQQLIKNSFYFHKKKGTPRAVELLATILFRDAKVQEWFEYDDEPGYFQITTSNQEALHEKALEFIRAVESVKRYSSKLRRVLVAESENLNLYIGFVSHTGEYQKTK